MEYDFQTNPEKYFRIADCLQLNHDNSNRHCKNVYEICKKIGFEPSLIVHVGAANSGQFEFMPMIEKGSEAWLFEPQPLFAAELREKWGNIPKIKIFEVAIYNKVGKQNLLDDWASSRIEEGKIKEGDGYFEVDCQLFSEFDNGKIELLLLDCESCEKCVIETMRSLPPMICCELHNIYGGKLHKDYDWIRDWMKMNGYQKIAINESDMVFLRGLERIN